MKIWLTLLTAIALLLSAQPKATAQEIDEALLNHLLDSIEQSFQWKTGPITLGDGMATLNVPPGWRYLPADQSNFVLTELWGNPPGASLGMLFPANVSPLDTNTWAFDLNFEEIGYVKDSDADDFDYNDILKNLQKEADEVNAERVKEGYEAVKIIGWASEPYYDKQKKVLHWAKEIQFGDDPTFPHTLNYDARVLGRKGVLSMNAIGDMGRLQEVKSQAPAVLASVNFNEGHRYQDFDSNVDEVAAWTIGGLVAGKVLAKAGFFALILKFIKPILLILGGGGVAFWRWLSGRKKVEESLIPEEKPKDQTPEQPNL